MAVAVRWLGVLLPVLLAAVPLAAQTEIGAVASSYGTAAVARDRAGAPMPFPVGSGVMLGDRVTTGADGAVVLLFRDDTIVHVGPSSQLSVERMSYELVEKRSQALLRLTQGKARIRPGERYRKAPSRFEIETPTAVINAKGGGDVVVVYDSAQKTTEVASLDGEVDVQAIIGLIGPAATLRTAQMTRVREGSFPSPVESLSQAAMASYTYGLNLRGTGLRDGVEVGHPAVTGRVLRPEDLPDVVDPRARPQAADAGGEAELALQPPGPTDELPYRLSRDLSATRQPIPEFRASPPGIPPSGNLQVDF
jgi:hypothetical protein